MTNARDTSRSRPLDADVVSRVPGADAVDVDTTVLPVGTFAAGQSADGRYVAVTAAPQGGFAAGQAEEDEPISPETAEPSPEAQPSRSD